MFFTDDLGDKILGKHIRNRAIGPTVALFKQLSAVLYVVLFIVSGLFGTSTPALSFEAVDAVYSVKAFGRNCTVTRYISARGHARVSIKRTSRSSDTFYAGGTYYSNGYKANWWKGQITPYWIGYCLGIAEPWVTNVTQNGAEGAYPGNTAFSKDKYIGFTYTITPRPGYNHPVGTYEYNIIGSDNVPPTANAGPDQDNIAPGSLVTISGSGSDTDGNIVKRRWTRVGGTGDPSVLYLHHPTKYSRYRWYFSRIIPLRVILSLIF